MQEWIAEKKPRIGAVATIAHPCMAELIKNAGFDWVWIDAEHGEFNEISASHYCAVMQRAVKSFVRIPDHSESTIKKYLDIGADGIIIPRVNSYKEIKYILEYALYPPKGKRSVGISRDNMYGESFSECIHSKKYAIIVQIETKEGVAHIEEIVAPEDIDAILIGPYDLSGSLGVLGDVTGHKVTESIRYVLSICQKRTKPCGVFASTPEMAKHYTKQGFAFIGVGVDASLMAKALKTVEENSR